MTDAQGAAIRDRLEEWRTSGRIRATSKPNFAADHRYMLALDELHDHAPSDLAALLEDNDRLRALAGELAAAIESARKNGLKISESFEMGVALAKAREMGVIE